MDGNSQQRIEQLKVYIQNKTNIDIKQFFNEHFEVLESVIKDISQIDVLTIENIEFLRKIIQIAGISSLYPLGEFFEQLILKQNFQQIQTQTQQQDQLQYVNSISDEIINELFTIIAIAREMIKPIFDIDYDFINDDEFLEFWRKIQKGYIDLTTYFDDKITIEETQPNQITQFFVQLFESKYKILADIKEFCEQYASLEEEQYLDMGYKIYCGYDALITSISSFMRDCEEIGNGEKNILISLQQILIDHQNNFKANFSLEKKVIQEKKQINNQKKLEKTEKLQKKKLSDSQNSNQKSPVHIINNNLEAANKNNSQNQKIHQNVVVINNNKIEQVDFDEEEKLERPCCKKFFYVGEQLKYDENQVIEYKDYRFPFADHCTKIFVQTICSFLNTQGGVILIGIDDATSKVNAISLTHKQQDELKLYFQNNIFNSFDPELALELPEQEREVYVQFIPVKNLKQQWLKGQWVVKVVIRQGRVKDTLYTYQSILTDGIHCSFRYDGNNQKIRTAEFKKKLIERSSNPQKLTDNHICVNPDPKGVQECKLIESKVVFQDQKHRQHGPNQQINRKVFINQFTNFNNKQNENINQKKNDQQQNKQKNNFNQKFIAQVQNRKQQNQQPQQQQQQQQQLSFEQQIINQQIQQQHQYQFQQQQQQQKQKSPKQINNQPNKKNSKEINKEISNEQSLTQIVFQYVQNIVTFNNFFEDLLKNILSNNNNNKNQFVTKFEEQKCQFLLNFQNLVDYANCKQLIQQFITENEQKYNYYCHIFLKIKFGVQMIYPTMKPSLVLLVLNYKDKQQTVTQLNQLMTNIIKLDQYQIRIYSSFICYIFSNKNSKQLFIQAIQQSAPIINQTMPQLQQIQIQFPQLTVIISGTLVTPLDQFQKQVNSFLVKSEICSIQNKAVEVFIHFYDIIDLIVSYNELLSRQNDIKTHFQNQKISLSLFQQI